MKINDMGKQHTMLRRISTKFLFTLALLQMGATVWGQAVIMNGDYFLTHNEAGTAVNATATTTFNPSTCLWVFNQDDYIRTANSNGVAINNNNNYLQYSSLTLGGNGFNWYSARNNTDVYHRTGYSSWNRTYYYLRLNGTTWQIDDTNSNNGTLYDVTITPQAATSTNPTINGADVLTATGNSTYTAMGAAYQAGGYTNYRFNNTDHYFDGNTAITPANATLTYAWSLESNSYATVNNSGVVTVSSLPQSDLTLTLTVTVAVSGGTPAAPAGTTLTASKEITIQGTTPSAPIINASGNSVTLSTEAAGTTSIRYTLDGSDPTATNGTVYNGAIDLSTSTTSPVTIKAVTVRNGNVSAVTTQVVTLTLPAPDITVNAEAGTATISATAGATIYYTTDGSEPTTSSSQYSGSLSGLSAMTTIKAIAVKEGWNDSPVASETLTISSGADGNTVTLFDYEDHNWTYYSGVDASVDGGNYNTNYAGKLYSPNPRNVKITYKANGGAVSIDESETEFVYYKTLEQGTTAGQYPYTVISNPFSKRPTGNGFGGWRIKEGAEYINGYNDEDVLPLDADIVFTNLPYPSVNCTSAEIELEATWVTARVTYLATVNNNNNNYTFNTTNGSVTTYENNFLVINRNYSGTLTVSQPVTILMVEPDGSDDYRDNYTFTGNITPNNAGVTKIEFSKWNSTNTVNANFRNLWIGRGMTTTSQCATLITGINTNNQTVGTKFSIKVESGKYDYFDFYKGHSTYTGGTANTGGTATGTAANAIITMGNDYDRAKPNTNNQNLEIKYGPMLGYQFSFASSNNRDNEHTLDLTVKSGRIGYTFFMENTNTAAYLQGGAGYCMYLSSAGAQTNVGRRNVLIEGGDICTIGSGIDSNNNAPSNNDTPSTTTNYNRLSFNVRIKGGTIHGNVYGGAAQSPSGGNRVMVMTGGQVKGWFAAGCNGTGNDGGQNYGTSFVYIGGNAKVDSEGSTKTLGYASGGNVYAAGAGRTGTTTCGEMTFGSNLVIADESYIERGAYGGGNYGYALSETNIYITGGTNEGKDGTVNDVTTKGGVFGGANQQNGPGINMYMTGGVMKGGVYGGCNTQGTISNNVTMNINAGQVGTSSKPANIHGGGYGAATRVSQNVDITLGASGQTTPGVIVYGDVYGGSALGYVNGTAATNTYHTYVTMNKGTINGSLYGGGLGAAGTAANVYGPVQVKVYGGSVRKTDANGANGSGGVYGANNVNGAPQRSVTVDIYGTDPAPSENEYALYAVYGGGNAADYTYGNGYPTVKVHNCDNSIEYVYGGGNAAAVAATDVTIYGGDKIGNVFGGGNGTVTAANVSGDTNVKIYGGTIGKVFGGSNSAGTIGRAINVTVVKQAGDTDPDGSTDACAMHIDEVYGGGNMADSQAGSISIGCTGNEGEGIGDVYGGANAADITGDISLKITGGSIKRVFGGNNASGSISGTIQVDVNWKTGNEACGYNYLGSVFGGGNLATYTGSPAVNILNGTVSGNVYGGGAGNLVDGTDRGEAGKVTGNPTVTIGDSDANHTAIVLGDVYGGGDAADVAGTPVIVVNDCDTEIGYLYGGGNAADVDGTNITVNGGTIHHDAFGGGHGDKDASSPSKYADVKGNVVFNVYGGTIDRVFAGSNSKGDISGTSTLTINKTGTCDMKIREAYGGGNQAAGNAGSVTIGCTGAIVTGDAGHAAHPENIGTTLEGIGTVYGGANAADIGKSSSPSNITLNINSGMVNNVFGGNNTSGTIYGTIAVNINKNAATCGWYVGNVFGGGNQAVYTAPTGSEDYPVVNILKGTVSGDVFGGGYGNASDPTKGVVNGNPQVTVNGANASVVGGVYGGGSLAPTVGNPVVTLTNGTLTNIYGGGKAAGVRGESTVNINGGSVSEGIYGGCNASGDVSGTITVNINGGTLGTSSARLTSGIFGGGFGPKTTTSGDVTVNIGDATHAPVIYGDIYGGSALGNVNSGTEDYTRVNLNAGTIHGDVYGGGLGQKTGFNGATEDIEAYVNGDVTVTLNGSNETGATNDCKVTGNIFGCNNLNGSPKGNVEVNIHRTVGYDDAHKKSTNKDNTTYDVAAVYGGGNMAAYVPNNPENTEAKATVNINGCDETSIQYVYGGGNAASVPASEVNVKGCYEIGYVFGGGNGKDKLPNGQENPGANVGYYTYEYNGQTGEVISGTQQSYGTGVAAVNLLGGRIHSAFGGSNTKGNVRSAAVAFLDEANVSCRLDIDDVYGGGNEAYMEGNAQIKLGCITELAVIYGGSKRANVGGDIVLNITSGHFDRIFGGNNESGLINGSITVNIEETGCHPITIGELYGCGNQAPYITPTGKADPTVNVKSFTSIGRIFGGGLGEGAVVTGNPTVNINEVVGKNASYSPWEYPGKTITFSEGDVTLPGHTAGAIGVIGEVFGGGNAADVIGNTTVNIGTAETVDYVSTAENEESPVEGANILGNVYGGGNNANVSGKSSVVVGRN